MLLITDLITESVKSDLVEENGIKQRYLIGPCAVAESVNKNNRIYPKGILESAFDTYIKEKLNEGGAWGELGHPTGPKINEKEVSHLFKELKWNNNVMIGKAAVLDNPYGVMIESMLKVGGKVGFSTRGLGSIKANSKGINEVQEDFKLASAADVVLDPSAPGCYVNGIMEGVEWIYDPARNDYQMQKIEDLQKEMHRLNKRELNERVTNAFEKYLKIILAGK